MDQDHRALNSFLKHYRIVPNGSQESLLHKLITSFAQLPYENLTKIIKRSEFGTCEFARRGPEEVVEDHKIWGTGGTCFSLSWTLIHMLRSLGWEAQPILADRPYGNNTHSALLVWIEKRAHLVDPGFLILKPVPIEGFCETSISTEFNRVILQRHENLGKVDLYTMEKGTQKKRLTYKIQPVEKGEFFKVWDDSFDWDMMRYPLLSRVVEGRQIYLKKTRLQFRSNESFNHRELKLDYLGQSISQEFGIKPAIVKKALEILKTRGEF